jgi:hypothetical protein
MELGMIGLGRMGANMVRRLMRGGHEVAVFDLNPASVEQLRREGASGAASLDDLVALLARPRAVWIMVPAGEPTEKTVHALAARLDSGDIIIDGGNSYFKDDVRRARMLEGKGIQYVDVGTSGGVWGLGLIRAARRDLLRRRGGIGRCRPGRHPLDPRRRRVRVDYRTKRVPAPEGRCPAAVRSHDEHLRRAGPGRGPVTQSCPL